MVVNPSIVNHPDVETFKACLNKTEGRLITVEDHQEVGGMGSVLVHQLSQCGLNLKVKSLGVKDQFGQSAYSAIQLYAKHGLDAKAITDAALSL